MYLVEFDSVGSLSLYVELQSAQRLTDIRSFSNTGHLNAFYETIDNNLSGRINELYTALPKNVDERQAALSDKLAALNPVLAKIKSPYNYYYYKSFLSFAHHIAEAHGGFLRFITIGPREAKVVDRPMIEPIAKPEEKDGLI